MGVSDSDNDYEKEKLFWAKVALGTIIFTIIYKLIY